MGVVLHGNELIDFLSRLTGWFLPDAGFRYIDVLCVRLFGFSGVLTGICLFKISTIPSLHCCAEFEHINLAMIL